MTFTQLQTIETVMEARQFESNFMDIDFDVLDFDLDLDIDELLRQNQDADK